MGALGSSILASARLPTMDCSASPLSNNGLWCLACLLFPESGCEGFYFSGLGGLGVGTERQIRGASAEHRGSIGGETGIMELDGGDGQR